MDEFSSAGRKTGENRGVGDGDGKNKNHGRLVILPCVLDRVATHTAEAQGLMPNLHEFVLIGSGKWMGRTACGQPSQIESRQTPSGQLPIYKKNSRASTGTGEKEVVGSQVAVNQGDGLISCGTKCPVNPPRKLNDHLSVCLGENRTADPEKLAQVRPDFMGEHIMVARELFCFCPHRGFPKTGVDRGDGFGGGSEFSPRKASGLGDGTAEGDLFEQNQSIGTAGDRC